MAPSLPLVIGLGLLLIVIDGKAQQGPGGCFHLLFSLACLLVPLVRPDAHVKLCIKVDVLVLACLQMEVYARLGNCRRVALVWQHRAN